jgi:hypothetical protein
MKYEYELQILNVDKMTADIHLWSSSADWNVVV